MDRPAPPYRDKFEKLGRTTEGEILAIMTPSTGGRFPVGEHHLLKLYNISATFLALLPGDQDLTHDMAVMQEARAAIQAYKTKHGIPFDTPPVSEASPPWRMDRLNMNKPANDEHYGADIYLPEF